MLPHKLVKVSARQRCCYNIEHVFVSFFSVKPEFNCIWYSELFCTVRQKAKHLLFLHFS